MKRGARGQETGDGELVRHLKEHSFAWMTWRLRGFTGFSNFSAILFSPRFNYCK